MIATRQATGVLSLVCLLSAFAWSAATAGTEEAIRWGGMRLRKPNADEQQAIGLAMKEGLVVVTVDANSPAGKAGLKAKDILVRLNQNQVPSDAATLAKLTATLKPDPTVELTVVRDGKEQALSIRGLPLAVERIQSVQLESVNGDMTVPLKGAYSQIVIADVNGTGKIEGTDLDAEEIWIGAVNGIAQVSLKGKTRKLRLGILNGDCQIDASELSADEVEVDGMNGSAKIKLLSAGAVRFTGELNGGATAIVKAKGEIRFAKIVQGASSLELFTRGDVILHDRLGGSARLKVLLSKDFTVKGDVGDSVRVEVNHFGQAKHPESPRAKIVLKKVASPE